MVLLLISIVKYPHSLESGISLSKSRLSLKNERRLLGYLQQRNKNTQKDKKCAKKYGFEPEPSKDLSCKTSGLSTTDAALATGATIGAGYVIYRVIRFIPSLAPPLWWSIPANVVTP